MMSGVVGCVVVMVRKGIRLNAWFVFRPGAYNMDVISDESTESADNDEGHVALRNTPDGVQFSAGLVLT